MNPTSVQAALTAVLGAAAIGYVARRRQRTDLHWLLIAVLCFMVTWSVGLAVLFAAETDAIARVGLTVAYLGALGLGPVWLLLALRFGRVRLFERRPGLLVAAFAPGAVPFLALVTNDGHRLYARSLRVEDLHAGPIAWAGPIFWVGLVWSLALVMGGIVVYARYAARLSTFRARARGLSLIAAGIIPSTACVLKYLDLVTFPADPTPLATALGVAIVFFLAVRYRILDMIPVARRDVLEHLAEGVIIADDEGTIVDLNPAAEGLLGPAHRALNAPLARTLARLTTEADAAALERRLDEALLASAPVTLAARTSDGRDLEMRAASVRDGDGETSGRYVVLRDVTGIRRYERLIRESQQRVVVGGMAAGIAHEVNNPLAFVASNLQQIRRGVSFEPSELEGLDGKRAAELRELGEVVDETIEGVERISRIVDRIQRGGPLGEEEVARIDLAQVVREAIQLVEFHREYPVPVRLGAIDGLPEVEGCPERLSQALLNVLLNAQQVAQGDPESAVRLDARLEGSAVSLRFGLECGGRPAPVPDRDRRGSEAEAELSAAYEIVQEHGGSLESGAAGDPSLYVVRLPAQPSLPR